MKRLFLRLRALVAISAVVVATTPLSGTITSKPVVPGGKPAAQQTRKAQLPEVAAGQSRRADARANLHTRNLDVSAASDSVNDSSANAQVQDPALGLAQGRPVEGESTATLVKAENARVNDEAASSAHPELVEGPAVLEEVARIDDASADLLASAHPAEPAGASSIPGAHPEEPSVDGVSKDNPRAVVPVPAVSGQAPATVAADAAGNVLDNGGNVVKDVDGVTPLARPVAFGTGAFYNEDNFFLGAQRAAVQPAVTPIDQLTSATEVNQYSLVRISMNDDGSGLNVAGITPKATDAAPVNVNEQIFQVTADLPNKKVAAENPLFNQTITHLVVDGQGRPVAAVNGSGAVYMVKNVNTGLNVLQTAQPDDFTKQWPLKDVTGGNDLANIHALAATTSPVLYANNANRSGNFIFAAASDNADWGAATAAKRTVSVIKNEETFLNPRDVTNLQEATLGNANKGALVDYGIAAGLVAINTAATADAANSNIDLWWDDHFQALYVGLAGVQPAKTAVGDAAVGLLRGTFDPTANGNEGAFKLSKISTTFNAGLFGAGSDQGVFGVRQNAGGNLVASVNLFKPRTLHTSTGKHYLLVNGGVDLAKGAAGSSGAWVNALPLTSAGLLAKNDGSFADLDVAANAVKVDRTVKVDNNLKGLENVVGGNPTYIATVAANPLEAVTTVDHANQGLYGFLDQNSVLTAGSELAIGSVVGVDTEFKQVAGAATVQPVPVAISLPVGTTFISGAGAQRKVALDNFAIPGGMTLLEDSVIAANQVLPADTKLASANFTDIPNGTVFTAGSVLKNNAAVVVTLRSDVATPARLAAAGDPTSIDTASVLKDGTLLKQDQILNEATLTGAVDAVSPVLSIVAGANGAQLPAGVPVAGVLSGDLGGGRNVLDANNADVTCGGGGFLQAGSVVDAGSTLTAGSELEATAVVAGAVTVNAPVYVGGQTVPVNALKAGTKIETTGNQLDAALIGTAAVAGAWQTVGGRFVLAQDLDANNAGAGLAANSTAILLADVANNAFALPAGATVSLPGLVLKGTGAAQDRIGAGSTVPTGAVVIAGGAAIAAGTLASVRTDATINGVVNQDINAGQNVIPAAGIALLEMDAGFGAAAWNLANGDIVYIYNGLQVDGQGGGFVFNNDFTIPAGASLKTGIAINTDMITYTMAGAVGKGSIIGADSILAQNSILHSELFAVEPLAAALVDVPGDLHGSMGVVKANSDLAAGTYFSGFSVGAAAVDIPKGATLFNGLTLPANTKLTANGGAVDNIKIKDLETNAVVADLAAGNQTVLAQGGVVEGAAAAGYTDANLEIQLPANGVVSNGKMVLPAMAAAVVVADLTLADGQPHLIKDGSKLAADSYFDYSYLRNGLADALPLGKDRTAGYGSLAAGSTLGNVTVSAPTEKFFGVAQPATAGKVAKDYTLPKGTWIAAGAVAPVSTTTAFNNATAAITIDAVGTAMVGDVQGADIAVNTTALLAANSITDKAGLALPVDSQLKIPGMMLLPNDQFARDTQLPAGTIIVTGANPLAADTFVKTGGNEVTVYQIAGAAGANKDADLEIPATSYAILNNAVKVNAGAEKSIPADCAIYIYDTGAVTGKITLASPRDQALNIPANSSLALTAADTTLAQNSWIYSGVPLSADADFDLAQANYGFITPLTVLQDGTDFNAGGGFVAERAHYLVNTTLGSDVKVDAATHLLPGTVFGDQSVLQKNAGSITLGADLTFGENGGNKATVVKGSVLAQGSTFGADYTVPVGATVDLGGDTGALAAKAVLKVGTDVVGAKLLGVAANNTKLEAGSYLRGFRYTDVGAGVPLDLPTAAGLALAQGTVLGAGVKLTAGVGDVDVAGLSGNVLDAAGNPTPIANIPAGSTVTVADEVVTTADLAQLPVNLTISMPDKTIIYPRNSADAQGKVTFVAAYPLPDKTQLDVLDGSLPSQLANASEIAPGASYATVATPIQHAVFDGNAAGTTTTYPVASKGVAAGFDYLDAHGTIKLGGNMWTPANGTGPIVLANDLTLGDKSIVALNSQLAVGSRPITLIDQPLIHIVDMQVVGDSAYVAIKEDSDAQNGIEAGVFKSTAVFANDGSVRGWTPWSRVDGHNDVTGAFGVDEQTGRIGFMTTADGKPGVMTVAKMSQWDNDNTNLSDLVSAAFAGGVTTVVSFDPHTPGFKSFDQRTQDPQFACMIIGGTDASGQSVVALAQTGVYDATKSDFVPTAAYTLGTNFFVWSAAAGTLPDLGSITSAEFSRMTAADSGWMFVGGDNGVAVLSRKDVGNEGKGATELDKLEAAAVANFSWKLLTNSATTKSPFTNVRKLAADGNAGFLYVVTPDRVSRVKMHPAAFSDGKLTKITAAANYPAGNKWYVTLADATSAVDGAAGAKLGQFVDLAVVRSDRNAAGTTSLLLGTTTGVFLNDLVDAGSTLSDTFDATAVNIAAVHWDAHDAAAGAVPIQYDNALPGVAPAVLVALNDPARLKSVIKFQPVNLLPGGRMLNAAPNIYTYEGNINVYGLSGAGDTPAVQLFRLNVGNGAVQGVREATVAVDKTAAQEFSMGSVNLLNSDGAQDVGAVIDALRTSQLSSDDSAGQVSGLVEGGSPMLPSGDAMQEQMQQNLIGYSLTKIAAGGTEANAKAVVKGFPGSTPAQLAAAAAAGLGTGDNQKDATYVLAQAMAAMPNPADPSSAGAARTLAPRVGRMLVAADAEAKAGDKDTVAQKIVATVPVPTGRRDGANDISPKDVSDAAVNLVNAIRFGLGGKPVSDNAVKAKNNVDEWLGTNAGANGGIKDSIIAKATADEKKAVTDYIAAVAGLRDATEQHVAYAAIRQIPGATEELAQVVAALVDHNDSTIGKVATSAVKAYTPGVDGVVGDDVAAVTTLIQQYAKLVAGGDTSTAYDAGQMPLAAFTDDASGALLAGVDNGVLVQN